jgi:prepilin-type N-terminal cleavage/methylation domain-containing protein
MKGGKRPLGYTIIELMIVLAVSGLMFAIAASFISGKQEKTSFTAGVNEMASRIQDTIEQVTDGKYSDILLNCSFSGATVTINSGGSGQGTNPTCTFLGKIMRFTPVGTSSDYKIIPLAGGLLNGSGSSPTLVNVHPTIISSLITPQIIPQNLYVAKMTVNGSPSYDNFGFTQSLGVANGTGSFQSGAQTISMVYSPITSGQPDSTVTSNVAAAQSAILCLSDGTQNAQIIIGANNNQLGVNVHRLSVGVACP